MKVTVDLPRDFALEPTVRSHGYVQTLPFAWDDATQTLERVDRMRPGGRPHVVRIRQVRRTLEVDVIGARNVPDRYVTRVRRILQLDRPLAGFHREMGREPHFAWIKKGRYGRILRCGDLFEDVVKAICGTNIQWPQAVKIANRIATLGPKVRGRHAFPEPAEVIAAGSGWLREEARAGYRAESIVRLAESIESGGLNPEHLEREAPSLSGDEVRKHFLEIRGVGPATARYLAAFLGKFDRVVVDSAVIAFAKDAYFGGETPSVKDVEARYAAYGEHAGLCAWFDHWNYWRQARGEGEQT